MMKNNKKVFDKGILITILMLIAAIVYSYLVFFVRGVDLFVDLIFGIILSGLLWFGALFVLYLHIKTFVASRRSKKTNTSDDNNTIEG